MYVHFNLLRMYVRVVCRYTDIFETAYINFNTSLCTCTNKYFCMYEVWMYVVCMYVISICMLYLISTFESCYC